MPFIRITTNAAEVSADLEKALGRAITALPGKTERWLMTNTVAGARMSFAGTEEPCVMAEVALFGSASADAYDRLTAELCRVLSDATGVAPDRIYVKYEEVGNWGFAGSNF